MGYWERRLAALSDVTKPTNAIACQETSSINLIAICGMERNAFSVTADSPAMPRTILKTIFEPFLIVLVGIYFLIDGLALSILRPLLRKLSNLKVFKFIARWIASLGPYSTLAFFMVPLVLLEPAKPLSAYLAASGHITLGVLVIFIGEILKIAIVERIFHIGRDKLMTIKAFAWIYNRGSEWLVWFQTLPPWQSAKHQFNNFVHWAHKLNRDGQAQGFR